MSKFEGIKKIFFYTLIISGTAWALWGSYFYFMWSRGHDSGYALQALVQTGEEKEALSTTFLAELLGLSKDSQVNLYRLNLKKLEEKLLQFPLIKRASVSRIPPSSLFIDYEIRKPIMFYGDVANTALDNERVLIPFSPFFSPKHLPTLYLGVANLSKWGEKVSNSQADLGFSLYELLKAEFLQEGFVIKTIDVSRSALESKGACQAVVILARPSEGSQFVLILDPYGYQEGIKGFKTIWKARRDLLVPQQSHIMDLRVANLAYLRTSKEHL
jgi:hypothetical protein